MLCWPDISTLEKVHSCIRDNEFGSSDDNNNDDESEGNFSYRAKRKVND